MRSKPVVAARLSPDRVRTNVYAKDWRDVVTQTGAFLEEKGFVEARYTTAMLELLAELGPYMVIAPGVALLHARPGSGVLAPGVVVLTLAQPVRFGHSENDPVWLVIGLAATDPSSHIDALTEIATCLAEPGVLNSLRTAQTPESVVEIIRGSLSVVTEHEGGRI